MLQTNVTMPEDQDNKTPLLEMYTSIFLNSSPGFTQNVVLLSSVYEFPPQ